MWWHMIMHIWNCISQRRKGNQTLGPEKLSAQLKCLLCGLLWEKKVSHKAASMKVCWQLNRWVKTTNVFKKSNRKKNWGTGLSVMQPNHKHTMDWLWLAKLEWCGVQLLGPCNVHGFSWCRRWDIREHYISMSHT